MRQEWIDISIPVKSGMIVWPGDPPVQVRQTSSLEKGDAAAVTRLELGTHTGTHVDAPAHYLAGGAAVDTAPGDAFIGPARVIRLASRAEISAEELAAAAPDLQAGERLLLRTANSDVPWPDQPFRKDAVHLGLDAARWLAERKLRLIGIDYLSVGGFAGAAQGPEVHKVLLRSGAWILEGVHLGALTPGTYDLVCLPLRIAGADGSPARAMVRPTR